MDYVVVTWTVEEAKCLADTLTPGHASKADWYPYAHRFTDGLPAAHTQRSAGSIEPASGKLVSDHDRGKARGLLQVRAAHEPGRRKLPIAMLWKQIIEETKPKLIITTGTAGGIGPTMQLGDVVVGANVRFDCLRNFKSRPFASEVYACSPLLTRSLPARRPSLRGQSSPTCPPRRARRASVMCASADVPCPTS